MNRESRTTLRVAQFYPRHGRFKNYTISILNSRIHSGGEIGVFIENYSNLE